MNDLLFYLALDGYILAEVIIAHYRATGVPINFVALL